jgi:hypothetical protein
MPLSLDGSAIAHQDSSATVVPSLTTSDTNDIIIVTIIGNATVSSVSSPSLGSFNTVPGAACQVSSNFTDIWWAKSSGALTGENITVTMSSSTYCTAIAFGVNGANTSSPFDANAVTNTGTDTQSVAISTTAANTFIVGAFLVDGNSPAAGWTQIQSQTTYNFTEYQLFSSSQSGLSVSLNGLSPGANGISAVAIVMAGTPALPLGIAPQSFIQM